MINSFRGTNFFLSNFHFCPVEYNGSHYRSVEHAFQAAKCLRSVDAAMIRQLANPSEAKRMGSRVEIKPNWDTQRLDIMEELLRSKFSDVGLSNKLIGTANEILCEENAWGDDFWGTCGGVGENHLGKLLMKIRDDLRR